MVEREDRDREVLWYGWAKKAALAIVVVLALIVVALLAVTEPGNTRAAAELQQQALPLVRIENAFIDMNGDGMVDYVIRADVVFNDSAYRELQSQPDPQPAGEALPEDAPIMQPAVAPDGGETDPNE